MLPVNPGMHLHVSACDKAGGPDSTAVTSAKAEGA
jgi:hypothetical protein